MNFRIIKNELLNNKVVNLTTMIFVATAAMLVSLAAILTVNLTGALDTLMEQAKTPHFMQMHSGEVDMAQFDAFVAQNSTIDSFQVLDFLNIESSKLSFDGKSLGGITQDNGFSVQSETFDFLLDLDGAIIKPKNGELYVPICYMKDNTTKIGDKAFISGQEFTVAGFLRDSQMNSTLSASKRFLVSNDDFDSIKDFGKTEYLIEFRLKDLSDLGEFETAYTFAELPANGPTITYGLFKTLNAFSDGIMIGVIFLVSILVVAIALMCIRFTLLAKIEDDYREIGVMKAIGLRIFDIEKIYLLKYAAIGLVGSILGYTLSLVFEGVLTENIRTFMGESKNASLAQFFGIFGVILIFFVILTYVFGVLRHLRKISPVEAIRFGAKQEKQAVANSFCLSTNKFIPTNIFLGMKDVFLRKKLYATMLFVLMIASFLMIVPQNLYNTISAKSFSSYMGIGSCDIRMDIQQTNNLEEKALDIKAILNSSSDIAKSVVLTTKNFRTTSDEMVKVELGDHSAFPIAYSQGKAPVSQNEIALSSQNADELSKQLGEQITLIIDGSEKELVICGIYSDITNGGKTAKANFEDPYAESMWSVICVSLTNQTLVDQTVSKYRNAFPFAKVSGVDEYISEIFGQTIRSVKTASYAAIAVALLITLLVTLLFIKMLIAKDRYSIAIMKAFGFTDLDITLQYVVRSVLILIISTLFGTFLANTLGETLAGMVIASFGASSFKFMVNPISAYLLCPLMMVFSVLIGAIFGTSGIGKIKISENIKE